MCVCVSDLSPSWEKQASENPSSDHCTKGERRADGGKREMRICLATTTTTTQWKLFLRTRGSEKKSSISFYFHPCTTLGPSKITLVPFRVVVAVRDCIFVFFHAFTAAMYDT